jgi:uncharacterized OsmC-like protein
MSESATHRASVVRKEGFVFEASFDAAPHAAAVTIDEPPPLGQASGPNAVDLLAAAVGNCLSASLLMCLQKSRAEIGEIDTTVTARMERNEKGRLRIAGFDVEIHPSLAAGDQAKLERCKGLFEDFCTVTASVRQGIPVQVSVTPSPGVGQ